MTVATCASEEEGDDPETALLSFIDDMAFHTAEFTEEDLVGLQSTVGSRIKVVPSFGKGTLPTLF